MHNVKPTILMAALVLAAAGTGLQARPPVAAPVVGAGTSINTGTSSGNMSAQGTANNNGLLATDRDKGQDRAADRTTLQGAAGTGLQGSANSNGPQAADRDKGMDRAADRRDDEAAENSKAGHAKKAAKKPAKAKTGAKANASAEAKESASTK